MAFLNSRYYLLVLVNTVQNRFGRVAILILVLVLQGVVLLFKCANRQGVNERAPWIRTTRDISGLAQFLSENVDRFLIRREMISCH